MATDQLRAIKGEIEDLEWAVSSKRQLVALLYVGEALRAHECKNGDQLAMIEQRLGELPVIRFLGPLDGFRAHQRISLQLIECVKLDLRSQPLAGALRRLGAGEGGLVRELFDSVASVVDE